MRERLLRQLRLTYLIFTRYLWRQKGLWLRALLCWLIGFAFVLADRNDDYDSRLWLRGEQPRAENVVVIDIAPQEWLTILQLRGLPPPPDDELGSAGDGLFWNESLWREILQTLFRGKPKAVGVTLFFGNNIPRPEMTPEARAPFVDHRVYWAARLGEGGQIEPSHFAKTLSKRTGIGDLVPDRDGMIRRLVTETTSLPHLSTAMVGKPVEPSPAINFRGKRDSFPSITVSDLLAGKVEASALQGKYILIGPQFGDDYLYRTPVGLMTRAEIFANLADNHLENRWITRAPRWLSALVIAIFVIFSAWITSIYPQFLALFILSWVSVLYSTLSIWVFDTFYVWLPVFAIIVASGVTYFVFLSFQLTLKEYLTDQLEKERQFLLDVEQLKNNFLSLISHDLKTPIAKIQAIVDRMMTEYPDPRMHSDLGSLRDIATDLHQYIHTLLQIAKVESRDFRVHRDATDLNELIEGVVHKLEPLAKAKSISLKIELEPMFLVEIDPVLMHEVVLNLIENAIKYTQEGGSVKVSSREVDEQVFVVVEDNGPGIPRDEQNQIFEKFYRGKLGKTQQKGSGLGLYLVKYFIELHGGKIFLDSEPGRGTRVGFRLPIQESESRESQTPTGETHEAQP